MIVATQQLPLHYHASGCVVNRVAWMEADVVVGALFIKVEVACSMPVSLCVCSVCTHISQPSDGTHEFRHMLETQKAPAAGNSIFAKSFVMPRLWKRTHPGPDNEGLMSAEVM